MSNFHPNDRVIYRRGGVVRFGYVDHVQVLPDGRSYLWCQEEGIEPTVAAPDARSCRLITPAPAPLPAGSLIKGMGLGFSGWGPPLPESHAAGYGIQMTREDVAWSEVEATQGKYDWGRGGIEKNDAWARYRSLGISVLPCLGYFPGWAGVNNVTEWQAFVAAAVKRYGPGTTYDLTWFELWNEPYLDSGWGRPEAPGDYARFLKAGVQAGRAANPSAKFLAAGCNDDGGKNLALNHWTDRWFDDAFAAVPDLGSYIDAISFHPYTGTGDPSLPLRSADIHEFRNTEGKYAFQRFDSQRALLKSLGVDVPFWLTEFGWSTVDVSEATQADFYAKAFVEIAKRPWIHATFPFCMHEFAPNPDQQGAFGLQRFDSFADKPAMAAVRKFYGV